MKATQPVIVPVDALNLGEKRAAVDSILQAWVSVKDLSLGQLLRCATEGHDIWALSDDDLVTAVALFAHRAVREK